jgi:hypothetical protein
MRTSHHCLLCGSNSMLLTLPSTTHLKRAMASGVRANQFSSFVKPRPRRAPSTPLPAMQVVLTQQEEDICNLLDDFCKTKNETNTSSEPLVCRIAGGWVRDKVRVTILTP